MAINNSSLSSTLIELHVEDFTKALTFYKDLGFELIRSDESYRVIAKGKNIINFYGGDKRIFDHNYFGDFQGAIRGNGVEIIIFENQIDSLYNEVKDKNFLIEKIQQRPWGARDFRLADPFGYYLRITEQYDNHNYNEKGHIMNSDIMEIEDASYKCRIGVTEAERARSQKIEISSEIQFEMCRVSQSKNIDQGLCWSKYNSFIDKELQSKEWILVEELIEHLTTAVLKEFPLISSIKMKIKKFEIINAKWTAIKVFRSR